MARANPNPLLAAALTLGAATAQIPPVGVDLGEDQHDSLRDAIGRETASGGRSLDDWVDRFELYGFVAGRYFDTAEGGARPDGALAIQAATLFVDVGVRDVGSAFLELRFDYFQEAGNNEVSIGEAYMVLRDVLPLGADTSLQLKVGRFDLPFGEYYLLEDPNRNRMIGFPAAIPYRWDEGVLGFADFGSWGFAASVSDGTYSRNSESGVAPAATVRLHARPAEGLYLSASAHHVHKADNSALCFGGSVITPVTGGAAGTSPSAEVRSTLGSLDVIWDSSGWLHLQASAGCGRIDDAVDSFDRTVYWWMFEPTVRLAPRWQTILRYSGVGTFDDQEGYAFEARPYGNGVMSYGFDLAALQRLAVAVRWEIAPTLTAKAEVGFDHLEATSLSGRRNDTRPFTAAELVLTF